MSQLSGGRADKFGNAFERLWVAYLALDVVEDRATSIRWEPLGAEGDGVDCEIRKPCGRVEKHQCKVNNGTDGNWKASDLKKVLLHAKAHLEADLNAHFVFVSRDSASVLQSLSERAGGCDGNAQDFLDYCLKAKHKAEYESLCTCWGFNSTDAGDAAIVIGLLSRMQFKQPPEKSLLYRLAEAVADGDGKRIITFLGQHLEEPYGKTHRATELREALSREGCPPLDLANNPGVHSGIEDLHASFRDALEPHLIGSAVLARPEPQRLVELLVAEGGSRLVFVTGDAGSGKSGVLLDALRILERDQVPYLPVRLDAQYPGQGLRIFCAERLGLPASPAACLRAIADGRRAVLVIDQLDAVRWTSANSDRAWERCKLIIDEALRLPKVSVVVAGRTVDLDEDLRIQNWRDSKEAHLQIDVQGFHVGAMPSENVASVLEVYDVQYASLTPSEKSLLSNAQSLQLWWRLAKDGKATLFSNRAALLRSYWSHYRDKAVRDYSVPRAEVVGLLEKLVGFLDYNGRLDAPNTLLDRTHGDASRALLGLNILYRTGGITRFSHQSHLDFLTIERVLDTALSGGITPIVWLRKHDQSLFRRDQVRFLLQLLRDEAPGLYLDFLNDIFFGPEVRFHIQHLALTTLAQAAPPTAEESAIAMRLLAEEEWRLHVLDRLLARHEPWLDCFTDNGVIPGMLTSGDDLQIGEALQLCYASADNAPAWFERVLAPLWDSGDEEWAERIGSRLAHSPTNDTDKVFQWRLAWSRRGADQPDIYNAESLAKEDPVRAIPYLTAIAVGLISNVEKAASGDRQRQLEVGSERFNNLLEICGTHSRLCWDSLLPLFEHAVRVDEGLRAKEYDDNTFRVLETAAKIVSLLHDFLLASGTSLILQEGTPFLTELEALGRPPTSSRSRKLAVDILATAPEAIGDDAVRSLLSLEEPFNIEAPTELMMRSDSLSSQDSAINAIGSLCTNCSAADFNRVEKEVLSLHTSRERAHVEWQLELIREDRWYGHPNHYGLAQYALLLALPAQRLSSAGKSALRMWSGKFGDLTSYRDNSPIEARSVVSPIPADKARFVSDEGWTRVVNGNWARRGRRWRESKEGNYIEASPSNFAYSLEHAGKLDPGRYVRLGLRFPTDTQECYFSSLLRLAGLRTQPDSGDQEADVWSPAPVSSAESLVSHIADKSSIEIAMGICRMVRDRSGEKWSKSTRDILCEYALRHPHPGGTTVPDSDDGKGSGSSLESISLNSVRCSAISAAAQLLWAHADLIDWASDLCRQAIQDPHPAVRVAALELAYAIGKHNQGLALELLDGAYEGTDDSVLAVQHGPLLLRVFWQREEELTPILRRALASSNEKAGELAAYWVTIGNIVERIYRDLARKANLGIPVDRAGWIGGLIDAAQRAFPFLAGRAFSAGPSLRVGVVRALVDLAHHHDDHRVSCLSILRSFLDDAEERVLDASDGMFRREGFLGTDEAPGFAEAFAHSRAFTRDPNSLLHQLVEHEDSLLPFAAAIEASVDQLSGVLLHSTQSMAHQNGLAGRDIATILLRLYQQSEAAEDSELRGRCLDQWDALLKARVGMRQDMLAKLDA